MNVKVYIHVWKCREKTDEIDSYLCVCRTYSIYFCITDPLSMRTQLISTMGYCVASENGKCEEWRHETIFLSSE